MPGNGNADRDLLHALFPIETDDGGLSFAPEIVRWGSIELDGTPSDNFRRERKTPIVGFDREKRVEEISIRVPVSRHPIDSVNLADPRLGLLHSINEKLKRLGIEYARVDLMVDSAERNVGLTVNEYETLLI